MTRAREAARLIGNNTFRLDSNNAVGFNSTTPDAMFDINRGLTVAGVSTFTGNVTMSGDLTVNGTTTTLDTVVQEVDLMNIQANSSTPGLGVTQSGAGAIIAAYDGTSEVFRVADGGNVGINETSPQQQLHVHDDTSYHGIFINGNGAPRINFARSTTTTAEWSVGVDGTDGTRFAIADSAGNTPEITITTGGVVEIPGELSIADKITHVGDTNTAIRFADADTVTIETSGSEALRIDSSGRMGLGTNSPGSYIGSGDNLVIAESGDAGLTIATGTSDTGTINFADGTSGDARYRGRFEYNHSTDALDILTAGTTQLRIASGGQVRIGSFGAPSNKNSVTPLFHVDGSGVSGSLQVNRHTTVGGGGSQLILSATRGSSITGHTVLQDDDGIGTIEFSGSDGGEFVTGARIQAAVDGTPGDDDLPTRLLFSTTADGGSSPTERMRIDSSGVIIAKNGAAAEIDTLTDQATVTPDLNASVNFTITLGGNRTLANPSALTAGQSGSIFVVQDGTGGRSFNVFGSYWDFIGGTVPTFTSTASAVDRIDYIVRSSTKIHAVFTANYS